MKQRALGQTGFSISPVVLGGNVFGWTADKETSFKLLDRFVEAGYNAIDTANSYQSWIPGHVGMSETIVGEWTKSRGKRDGIVLITKVGSDIGQGRKDLSAVHIAQAAEDSLKRLQTDRIDVYLSHWFVEGADNAETLAAYDRLIRAGKVRSIGCSNFNAKQLADALQVAHDNGLPRYQVLEPEYNLYDRASLDGPLLDLAMREEMGVITYFALAKGFLSGKYRSVSDMGKSPRGGGIEKYLNQRGFRIIDALDDVAAKHWATPAEVAIAWIIAAKGVTAPIASATSLEQLESLIKAGSLELSQGDLAQLNEASEPAS